VNGWRPPMDRFNGMARSMRGRKGTNIWDGGHGGKTIEERMSTQPISRALKSTWWSWEDGSRPFHWRWPEDYQVRIRDGIPVYFVTAPPIYLKPQRDEKDPPVKRQVTAKLAKARERCYIGPGQVVSLTSFFGVPKGEDDIRMVYDGSVSGLNDAIWVPGFTLPTVLTHLRAVEAGTFMADVDVGEMFLNFMLHSSIRLFAGVDISHFFSEDSQDVKRWETWYRAAMGLTSSPYQACQVMGYAEEVMRGNRLDGSNVFRWDRVRLNLPGAEAYRPDLPWVSKVRDSDGRVAADVFSFVDDLRPTGPTKRDA
jgi:hypothetical protein